MQGRYAQVFNGEVEECRFSPGSSVSIGRHSRNDITVNHIAVSRFHATIRWEPTQQRPLVYDHHSHNGTTVDKKGIVNVPLAVDDGSIIGVGGATFEIRLVSCDGPALLRGAEELVSLYTEDRPLLRGEYDHGHDLQKALHRLEAERRTGTLTIDPEAGVHGGSVTLCMGRIMAVHLGRALNTRALQHLLELRGPGRYSFTGDFEPTDDPMQLWFSTYLRERYPSRGTEPLYRVPRPRGRKAQARRRGREAC